MKQVMKGKRVLKRHWRILLYLLFFFLLSQTTGLYYVRGNAMYPSLRDGDLILFSRLSSCRNGDIAVYNAEGKTMCGRISGLGGDHVEIRGGKLLRNGTEVYETYAYPEQDDTAGYEETVQEGYVLFLNDQRGDHGDSRTSGTVSVSSLKGKAVMVIRRRGF